MLGPNGALPIHFTEAVRERTESYGDRATADFLDMFHHRALTQFYRAWAQAQASVGLTRRGDERFARYIGWLSGTELDEIAGPLPSHALLSACAHHVREARNPEGITAALSQFLGVPVRLDEFVLHWIAIASDEASRLGRPGVPSILGQGAILGEVVPDRQHKFRLDIGPLDLEAYQDLMPGGPSLPGLVEWVRSFVGFGFCWEVTLRLKRSAAPAAALGSRVRLGCTAWLGEPKGELPLTGVTFAPENSEKKLYRGSSRP
jgi:type VI secretion system protein ImpH